VVAGEMPEGRPLAVGWEEEEEEEEGGGAATWLSSMAPEEGRREGGREGGRGG